MGKMFIATLNRWQACVSDGTEFHCHVHFNVNICVKSHPSKLFELKETKVSCGQVGIIWGVIGHCNPTTIDWCVRRNIFIQEPPMFQRCTLSTPHPHSLQLPSLSVTCQSAVSKLHILSTKSLLEVYFSCPLQGWLSTSSQCSKKKS
jgi:hypothetical protein